MRLRRRDASRLLREIGSTRHACPPPPVTRLESTGRIPCTRAPIPTLSTGKLSGHAGRTYTESSSLGASGRLWTTWLRLEAGDRKGRSRRSGARLDATSGYSLRAAAGSGEGSRTKAGSCQRSACRHRGRLRLHQWSNASTARCRTRHPAQAWSLASERPKTPLNDAALLTNAHGEPSLASELRAELDSADSDRSALRVRHVARASGFLSERLRRSHAAGVPFRVVTTTYIGGTEREALDRLVRDFGAEVKMQYDAARTRLHAKAGSSIATLASTPRTSARRTSRPARCSRASSGTCGSRTAATPSLLHEVSRRLSTRTGTAPSSSRTTRTAIATGSTTRSTRRRASQARPGHHLASRASRSGRIPTSRRCSTPSRSSASCTTGTATWWSPRRERARPSSPRWTTGGSARSRRRQPALLFVAHRKRDPRAVAADLSRGAGRRQTSASSTSAERGPSAGSTSSPACSR